MDSDPWGDIQQEVEATSWQQFGQNTFVPQAPPGFGQHYQQQSLFTFGLQNSPDVNWSNPPLLLQYRYENEFDREILIYYKTQQCFKQNCQGSDCVAFHSWQERRRTPMLISPKHWNYEPFECQNQRNCNDDCNKAHNDNEINYHPLTYKINRCNDCSDPDLCSNAHSSSQIRQAGLKIPDLVIDIREYKKNQCSGCNNQVFCFCFHSKFDYRRKSQKYQPIPCKNAFQDQDLSKLRNCPKGDECGLAHNKFEIWYHQNFFRKNQCLRENCQQVFCPFIHDYNLVLPENDYVPRQNIQNEDVQWEEPRRRQRKGKK